MRKLILLLVLSPFLISFSCDEENAEMTELSLSDLLVQGSPWTFDRYEMTTILDDMGSDITQQEIEDDIDQSSAGIIFTFNADGTGSEQGPSSPISWTWEIVNGEDLLITFSEGENQLFEEFGVNASEMYLAIEAVTFDEDLVVEVLHYGRLYFK